MQALHGSMAALDDGSGTIPYSWWQASGTIPDANIKEHVELPTVGQAYVGGTLANAWTIAALTDASGISGDYSYLFDAQTGRIILGVSLGGINGFFFGSWNSNNLFSAANAVYFLISNGTTIQAYRNNIAIGGASTSGNDIGGTARWRNNYNNTTSPWESTVPRAAIYNIALDASQRAALLTSMNS